MIFLHFFSFSHPPLTTPIFNNASFSFFPLSRTHNLIFNLPLTAPKNFCSALRMKSFFPETTPTRKCLSNSCEDVNKCSRPSNSPRHRMHVLGNDPSPLICAFKPGNQYNVKRQLESLGRGQLQLDNSEAGQQFQLDGSNKPQPETENKKGEWWQELN